MAEVATKKSINVVSSKKSEVCSVQSNNGLIDLDNINASNNQLISLCDNNDDDDDLILTKNTRNELDSDDKSLQELIESELALRICSNSDADEVIVDSAEDPEETTTNQPETVKRIVLDRQQDHHVDINTEFIIAETEHCSLIEEPYGHQNGYATSETSTLVSSSNNGKPGPVPKVVQDKQEVEEEQKDRTLGEQPEVSGVIVVEKTISDEIDLADDDGSFPKYDDSEKSATNPQFVAEEQRVAVDALNLSKASNDQTDDVGEQTFQDDEGRPRVTCLNKYQEEEIDPIQSKVFGNSNEEVLLSEECPKERCDPERKALVFTESGCNEQTFSANSQQGGQFSDSFDDSLYQQNRNVEVRIAEEGIVGDTSVHSAKMHDSFGSIAENPKVDEPIVESPMNCSQDESLSKAASTIDEHQASNSSWETEASHSEETVYSLTRPKAEEDVENIQLALSARSRSFDEGTTPSQSEGSTDAASTQEFIDIERRVLSEEATDQTLQKESDVLNALSADEANRRGGDLTSQSEKPENKTNIEESFNIPFTVNELALVENTEVVVSDSNITVFMDTKHHSCTANLDTSVTTESNDNFDSWVTVEEATKSVRDSMEEEKIRQNGSVDAKAIATNDEANVDNSLNEKPKVEDEREHVETFVPPASRAPLATPDDETSDISNLCDSESREETITTSSSVVTSSSGVKSGTKTKKKKIEGVSGNDASPNLTPRTKKTKKSKKSELEKENISVKSSFNKFDALSKKTVLHVRSVDAGKVQQQLNTVGQNGDTNPNCRSCGKVVFQMEQTKAEGLVWHKNCFRCVQCSKQLNVDNYESHESTLYCKAHFKELFQPKPVEESDQPVRPRKPELIIRENEPKELPPDVVRASDKPDLGLQELSSLNVKSRFQVFEKAGTENANEIERSPSQIAVKRSPSILSKLAKFQAKGMDIGVADESLNGIPYEESSESEEDGDAEETEELDTEIVKAKRTTRERPISFSKMDDIKNRWESTSQQGRREVQREARKEEIAGIRSRLFMGKQCKMKEMYQQAVAGSERVTKINAAEEIQHSAHARSIKERFERGEPIAASDDETDSKPKPEKADEEVIAAGISRKSRSLFLELDASAAKTGRPVTPVNPKTPADAPRRARDMDSPEREIYRDPDVVRADDRVNEVVHTDTARKMLSIFRQMEENASKEELPDGPKPLKRFTPPPEDKFAKQTASDSEDEEDEEGEESEGDDSAEERDPNYVRASDKVEDEFLKQAQNAARAKTLRAKFEHWDETDGKTSNQHHIPEMDMAQGTGEQSSIESASSLRARFESLGSQTNDSLRTPKVKVNRFVEIQSGCTDVCESCEKKVYPLEKVETNNKIFHKQCFRCLQCNCILRMDTFTLNNGKLYCIPHFKQLFITRGNYDEGFGMDPHKNKWATANANSAAQSPIAVSNGDV